MTEHEPEWTPPSEWLSSHYGEWIAEIRGGSVRQPRLAIGRTGRPAPLPAANPQRRPRKRRPCVVCGEDYQGALDNHHVYSKWERQSRTDIDASVCISLCASCHRKYHFGQPATVDAVALVLKELGIG